MNENEKLKEENEKLKKELKIWKKYSKDKYKQTHILINKIYDTFFIKYLFRLL